MNESQIRAFEAALEASAEKMRERLLRRFEADLQRDLEALLRSSLGEVTAHEESSVTPRGGFGASFGALLARWVFRAPQASIASQQQETARSRLQQEDFRFSQAQQAQDAMQLMTRAQRHR